MSDVQFSEEEEYLASLRRPTAHKAGSRGLLSVPVRLGLVKDEAGATALLAGVAVAAFVLAVVVFFVSL